MSGGRKSYQRHLIEPQRHETHSGGTALAWLLLTGLLVLSILVLTGVIW
jgi:hypothetical protein